MFQRIIHFSIHHKVVVCVLTVALMIWGVISLLQLPFDSTPDITNNQVQVITQAPALGAQEVEQTITTPIEMAMANIPRVIERRSISRSGLSVVTLVFDDAADIYWARALVEQQLKEAEESLPSGQAKAGLAPITTGLGEIYHYTLRAKKGYEDRYSLTELRTLQDWIVRKQLSGTPGVAEVSGWGGYVKQYEVAIDMQRLQAAGLTVGEVFTALQDNNENTGGSYIEQHSNQYFIRGLGLVRSLEDIGAIPVKTTNGIPVLVRDVATVQLGHALRYGAVTRDGEGEVVAGITMMLKGENFQEVIANIKTRVAQIQKSLPEGVVIEPYIDRTQLVDRVTHTITRNLVEGGLIVLFILILFLGNYRAGLIVASVIPLSMLFAFGMMRLFGVSGNLMSLGAIDFGLIVDGAVIIVEAVVLHISRSNYGKPRLSRQQMDREVYVSASKIRKSAAFGEIIIMIVYIPLFTLSGIEGKMFRPMAMTIFFAILGAFILSLTYVPMASALFLSRDTKHRRTFSDRLIEWLHRRYLPILDFCLNRRKAVIAGMVVLLAGSVWGFSRLGGEFIPNLEEGDLAAEISVAQGTSLAQMVECTSKAETILKQQFPEVKQVVTRIGSAEIPTDPMPVERGDMFIALKPKSEWVSAKTQGELMEKMDRALAVLPGVEIEMTQPIQMRTNELITGIKQDVAIKIYGSDIDRLSRLANEVAQKIKKVEGVTAPYVEKVQGLPQLQVHYDRARLAHYGISIRQANDLLRMTFAGEKAGDVYEGEKRFDLTLRLDPELRNDMQQLDNLYLPTSDGGSVPLSQVADIRYETAPSQITHESGERRIYVGFNVRGRDVESTVNEIQELLDKELQLPAGYYYTYGGQFQNLEEATSRLLVAVPLALLLILCLLYATMRSVRETLFVFSAIPLAAIGGIFALWLRGMPFSISAGVGFIALSGVAVLNGIVLIGQFNTLERAGVSDLRKRIEQGCELRLRPVLMTALVASLGFLPMALSQGDGAEVQRPLATVVIGGLLTATVLTLLVLPAIYKTFTREKRTNPSHHMKPSLHPTQSLPIMTGLIVLLTLAGAGVLSAGAQGRGDATTLTMSVERDSVVTLSQCIEAAAEVNPSVRRSALEVKRAAALEGTAVDLDNTGIALSQDPSSGGSTDNSLTVSQAFDFPTLYRARKQALRAETAVRKSEEALSRHELTRQVGEAYYDCLYAREAVRVYLAQAALCDRFLTLAETRHQLGEANQLEPLNARRIKQEYDLALARARNEYALAQQTLQLWIGAGHPVTPADSTLTPPDVTAPVGTPAVSQTPWSEQLARQTELGERNLKVARQSFLPSFEVGLRSQLLLKGFNPYHIDRERFKGNFMGFEVGVNVPLFFGAKRARLRAAKVEVEALQEQARELELSLDRQYRTALGNHRLALETTRQYRTEGLPQADTLVRISTAAYEKGEIDYVEYANNLRTALETRLNSLNALRELCRAALQLNYLSGR